MKLCVDTKVYLDYKNISRGGQNQVAKDAKRFITILQLTVDPRKELSVFKHLGFSVDEKTRTIAYSRVQHVRISAKVARETFFDKGNTKKQKMADQMLYVKYIEFADGTIKKVWSSKNEEKMSKMMLQTFFLDHVADRHK